MYIIKILIYACMGLIFIVKIETNAYSYNQKIIKIQMPTHAKI